MKELSKTELEKLSTKRLLAYKKKHYSHRLDNHHGSDCFCYYCIDTETYRKEHNEKLELIKSILNQREHV